MKSAASWGLGMWMAAVVGGSALVMPARMLALDPAVTVMPFEKASESGGESTYSSGTKAMNEKRWLDAVHAFDRVVAAKGDRVDAALYWRAYALEKMHRGSEAAASCEMLRARYASSTWNRDCGALAIDQMPMNVHVETPPVPPMPSTGPLGPMGPVGPIGPLEMNGRGVRDPNAELKILALNSLLNQDPAKAIPVLRGILTGDQPDSVKRHAIFVLAQSKSPEAQGILNDAVKGKMTPELQRQAIQMMAVFEGKKANDTLAEVYRTTSDPKVKRSVVQAMFITQDAPRMVEIARSEKDLELKRQIVSQLALMHDKVATDYMLELLK